MSHGGGGGAGNKQTLEQGKDRGFWDAVVGAQLRLQN